MKITNSSKLAEEEEKITKKKALELFDKKIIENFEIGTFKGLQEIHKYLFQDIYYFAGKIRDENISKGNFRFAPVMYLKEAFIAHPFREGNGRSTRIWIDRIFIKELGKVVDWSKIDKNDYLLAMERSPIKDTEIKILLKEALTDKINDRTIYMKGIDASYYYEGYVAYKIDEL